MSSEIKNLKSKMWDKTQNSIPRTCLPAGRFNNSTIQQFNNSTIQQFNNSTIQQFNNSTIQQFNNPTIQIFAASTWGNR
ncbi:MAG: hypothetical protein ACJA2S_003768 [Cyclobacteriaceae bacterium]